MARHIRIAASVAAAAVVATGMVATSGFALATPPAASSPAAAVEEQWEHTAELQELKTNDDKGMFYTLNEEEAEQAESVHGFRPTGEAAGIQLFTKKVPGSIPAHRLKRLDVPFHTYIVSSNEEEIEALTSESQPGLKFKDEGVVGHVLVEEEDGLMPLYRYTKDTVYRLARDNRTDLLAAGYKRSRGTIGYVPNG